MKAPLCLRLKGFGAEALKSFRLQRSKPDALKFAGPLAQSVLDQLLPSSFFLLPSSFFLLLFLLAPLDVVRFLISLSPLPPRDPSSCLTTSPHYSRALSHPPCTLRARSPRPPRPCILGCWALRFTRKYEYIWICRLQGPPKTSPRHPKAPQNQSKAPQKLSQRIHEAS